MKNTIARGAEAELMVALVATQRGYTISLPTTHHSEYDMIIDTGHKLHKIQVKRAYNANNRGTKVLCVETRRVTVKHSGKIGAVAKTYTNNGYDFLIAVDCDNQKFWIIPREFTLRYKAQIHLGKNLAAYCDQWGILAHPLPL